MCELLVGLPDINFLAVDDRPDGPIRVVIESCLEATLFCRVRLPGLDEGPADGRISRSSVFTHYRLRFLLYAGRPTGTSSPPCHPAEIRRA